MKFTTLFGGFFFAMLSSTFSAEGPNLPGAFSPLALHPDNPRYFLFREKPAILVTSGEHYGALLNADFDFETYFATLAADGFNLTRVFSGVYCEPEGAFKIARNTLAPGPGKLVAPFARSDTPGYGNGGTKFDLARWNPFSTSALPPQQPPATPAEFAPAQSR